MEHDPFDTFPPHPGLTLLTQMPEDGLEATLEVHMARLITYHRGQNSIDDSQRHVIRAIGKENQKMHLLTDDYCVCIPGQETKRQKGIKR